MQDYGDIIDRYTILYIKHRKKQGLYIISTNISDLINELTQINLQLWILEDNIRVSNIPLEEAGKLGLLIGILNDKRCYVKNQLNKLIGNNSDVSEKLYNNKEASK